MLRTRVGRVITLSLVSDFWDARFKSPGPRLAEVSWKEAYVLIIIFLYCNIDLSCRFKPLRYPASLALVGQQDSVPSSEIDLSAIPDSPLAKDSTLTREAFAGAIPLDRESTKSESPELRASVHEVLAAGSIDAPVEQPITSAISPESPTIPSFLAGCPSDSIQPPAPYLSCLPNDIYSLGLTNSDHSASCRD